MLTKLALQLGSHDLGNGMVKMHNVSKLSSRGYPYQPLGSA